MYDLLVGSFISPDSIVPQPGSSGGFNRYRYARNNPLRYSDPTGHFIFEDEPDDPEIWRRDKPDDLQETLVRGEYGSFVMWEETQSLGLPTPTGSASVGVSGAINFLPGMEGVLEANIFNWDDDGNFAALIFSTAGNATTDVFGADVGPFITVLNGKLSDLPGTIVTTSLGGDAGVAQLSVTGAGMAGPDNLIGTQIRLAFGPKPSGLLAFAAPFSFSGGAEKTYDWMLYGSKPNGEWCFNCSVTEFFTEQPVAPSVNHLPDLKIYKY